MSLRKAILIVFLVLLFCVVVSVLTILGCYWIHTLYQQPAQGYELQQ